MLPNVFLVLGELDVTDENYGNYVTTCLYKYLGYMYRYINSKNSLKNTGYCIIPLLCLDLRNLIAYFNQVHIPVGLLLMI